MASFAKYLIVISLLAACVGVLNADLSEAEATEVMQKMQLLKMLHSSSRIGTSETSDKIMAREIMNSGLKGIPCAESCVFIPCTVTALLGCSCKNNVCYT